MKGNEMFHSVLCEDSLNCEICKKREQRIIKMKRIGRRTALYAVPVIASMLPVATLAVLANRVDSRTDETITNQ